MGLPTRRRKERPTDFKLSVVREGEREYVEFPTADMVGTAAFLVYEPPGYVANRAQEKGIRINRPQPA